MKQRFVSGRGKSKVVADSSSILQEGSAGIRARPEDMGAGYLCTPVSGSAKCYILHSKLSIYDVGKKHFFSLYFKNAIKHRMLP